jgi:hypothetical protein
MACGRFVDGSHQPNNFEGVACYNNRVLYAISDAVFDEFPDPNDNAPSYFAQREEKAPAFPSHGL